jgi:hypothetical protein
LKEEALDRTMWRARFVRGFVPVVRQTTKCKDEKFACACVTGSTGKNTSTETYTELSCNNVRNSLPSRNRTKIKIEVEVIQNLRL